MNSQVLELNKRFSKENSDNLLPSPCSHIARAWIFTTESARFLIQGISISIGAILLIYKAPTPGFALHYESELLATFALALPSGCHYLTREHLSANYTTRLALNTLAAYILPLRWSKKDREKEACSCVSPITRYLLSLKLRSRDLKLRSRDNVLSIVLEWGVTITETLPITHTIKGSDWRDWLISLSSATLLLEEPKI